MRLAEHISEVEQRPSFAKHSIGTQITQTADSIAANVSESHGRYHYEENDSVAIPFEALFRKHERGCRRPGADR